NCDAGFLLHAQFLLHLDDAGLQSAIQNQRQQRRGRQRNRVKAKLGRRAQFRVRDERQADDRKGHHVRREQPHDSTSHCYPRISIPQLPCTPGAQTVDPTLRSSPDSVRIKPVAPSPPSPFPRTPSARSNQTKPQTARHFSSAPPDRSAPAAAPISRGLVARLSRTGAAPGRSCVAGKYLALRPLCLAAPPVARQIPPAAQPRGLPARASDSPEAAARTRSPEKEASVGEPSDPSTSARNRTAAENAPRAGVRVA